MGFFDFLKKKEDVQQVPVWPAILGAECKGTVVPMENIPDEVFSQGILGQCIGIDPAEGKVFAPVDGEITQAPDSGHALGLMSIGGVEVLIHVGVDTVEMRGDGFAVLVEKDAYVTAGTPLIVFDREKIRAAGHDDIVMVSVTNASGEALPAVASGAEVRAGEPLFTLDGRA